MLLWTLVLIIVAASADPVIPPNVAWTPVAAANAGTPNPVIDRTNAREITRLRALPLVIDQQSRMLADGEVQSLDQPIRLAIPHTSTVVAVILGRITIEGGKAARLRFHDVPAGTALWLAGSEDEDFIRFEPSNTAIWGPTTRGSIVYIAAEGGAGEIEITELAHIAPIVNAQTSCLSDVACRSSDDFAELAEASRAIGYVRFVKAGKSYVCTGGLLNDAVNSRTPYLLTAQHCISTKEEAASVEVIWDLKTTACGSNRLTKGSRSLGGELLVASAKTDVALLHLVSVPPDRVFLGLDTNPLPAGTVVHRLSHAGGDAQSYSSGIVDDTGMTCSSAPRPQFLYTRPRVGATTGGSSGAPVLAGGLYVAGQLRGSCGPDPSNMCATFNSAVDGSLRESWPLLAPYLDPASIRMRRRAVR